MGERFRTTVNRGRRWPVADKRQLLVYAPSLLLCAFLMSTAPVSARVPSPSPSRAEVKKKMPPPKAKPELVQFGDLTIDHFKRHAVWVGVHTMDYGEPWYDDTDEETFRPWLGRIPVNPADGEFLVRATFVLADGTTTSGFATPATEAEAHRNAQGLLGTMQPNIFLPDGTLGSFWNGILPEGKDAHAAFYKALGREARTVFPATFTFEKGLAKGVAGGVIEGFYYLLEHGKAPAVRR